MFSCFHVNTWVPAGVVSPPRTGLVDETARIRNLICFIDHFDSFSFNVLAWLRQGSPGARFLRVASDDLEFIQRLHSAQFPVVLSPGPGHPLEAHASMNLCRALMGRVPVRGLCLGHQIIGAASGWEIVRSSRPFHGSRKKISVVGESYFWKGQNQFHAATYNSLVLTPPIGSIGKIQSGDTGLKIVGTCEDGEIQAVETSGPVKAVGVQFHPESFLSDDLSGFRDRWLQHAADWFATQSSATAPLLMPS